MGKPQAKKAGTGRPKRERASRSIQFPEGTLDAAVIERGLMDVEIYEALGVGSSTWFRWKREDRVPTARVYDVTTLLGLPAPVTDGDVPRNPWFVMRTLESFDARIARLEQHLLGEGQGRRRPRSS